MSISQESWEPEIDLGARLRAVRRGYAKRTGRVITQVQMADMLGESPKTYEQWEAGKAVPRDVVGLAKRVAESTGIKPGWLLGLGGSGYYRSDPDGPARSEQELVAA